MSITSSLGLTPVSGTLTRFGKLRRPVGLLAWLSFVLKVRAERRALMALSDHELKDLGLTRSGADVEASRGLLDLPAQWPVDRRRA